jgi:hypothetical protein
MGEMELGPADGSAFDEVGVVGRRVGEGLVVRDGEGLAVFDESEGGEDELGVTCAY